MSRLISIGALAVLVALICFFGVRTTLGCTDELAEVVASARAISEQGEYERAKELCEKAREEWDGCHAVLCTFMSHSRLEAVDQTLATLPALCREDSIDQFLSECDRGTTQLKYLRESEIPSLQNIL